MMELKNSIDSREISRKEKSDGFLRLLTVRQTVLSFLCEEVRNGRLIAVNVLFEPLGFAVNPEFMRTLSGRLHIMRDIETALNELDDEVFLAGLFAIETSTS
jgi:hypothetical protein